MNVKVNMIDREVCKICHKNVMRDLHLFRYLNIYSIVLSCLYCTYRAYSFFFNYECLYKAVSILVVTVDMCFFNELIWAFLIKYTRTVMD